MSIRVLTTALAVLTLGVATARAEARLPDCPPGPDQAACYLWSALQQPQVWGSSVAATLDHAEIKDAVRQNYCQGATRDLTPAMGCSQAQVRIFPDSSIKYQGASGLPGTWCLDEDATHKWPRGVLAAIRMSSERDADAACGYAQPGQGYEGPAPKAGTGDFAARLRIWAPLDGTTRPGVQSQVRVAARRTFSEFLHRWIYDRWVVFLNESVRTGAKPTEDGFTRALTAGPVPGWLKEAVRSEDGQDARQQIAKEWPKELGDDRAFETAITQYLGRVDSPVLKVRQEPAVPADRLNGDTLSVALAWAPPDAEHPLPWLLVDGNIPASGAPGALTALEPKDGQSVLREGPGEGQPIAGFVYNLLRAPAGGGGAGDTAVFLSTDAPPRAVSPFTVTLGAVVVGALQSLGGPAAAIFRTESTPPALEKAAGVKQCLWSEVCSLSTPACTAVREQSPSWQAFCGSAPAQRLAAFGAIRAGGAPAFAVEVVVEQKRVTVVLAPAEGHGDGRPSSVPADFPAASDAFAVELARTGELPSKMAAPSGVFTSAVLVEPAAAAEKEYTLRICRDVACHKDTAPEAVVANRVMQVRPHRLGLDLITELTWGFLPAAPLAYKFRPVGSGGEQVYRLQAADSVVETGAISALLVFQPSFFGADDAFSRQFGLAAGPSILTGTRLGLLKQQNVRVTFQPDPLPGVYLTAGVSWRWVDVPEALPIGTVASPVNGKAPTFTTREQAVLMGAFGLAVSDGIVGTAAKGLAGLFGIGAKPKEANTTSTDTKTGSK